MSQAAAVGRARRHTVERCSSRRPRTTSPLRRLDWAAPVTAALRNGGDQFSRSRCRTRRRGRRNRSSPPTVPDPPDLDWDPLFDDIEEPKKKREPFCHNLDRDGRRAVTGGRSLQHSTAASRTTSRRRP